MPWWGEGTHGEAPGSERRWREQEENVVRPYCNLQRKEWMRQYTEANWARTGRFG
jgi:hypothetical protein